MCPSFCLSIEPVDDKLHCDVTFSMFTNQQSETSNEVNYSIFKIQLIDNAFVVHMYQHCKFSKITVFFYRGHNKITKDSKTER